MQNLHPGRKRCRSCERQKRDEAGECRSLAHRRERDVERRREVCAAAWRARLSWGSRAMGLSAGCGEPGNSCEVWQLLSEPKFLPDSGGGSE